MILFLANILFCVWSCSVIYIYIITSFHAYNKSLKTSRIKIRDHKSKDEIIGILLCPSVVQGLVFFSSWSVPPFALLQSDKHNFIHPYDRCTSIKLKCVQTNIPLEHQQCKISKIYQNHTTMCKSWWKDLNKTYIIFRT